METFDGEGGVEGGRVGAGMWLSTGGGGWRGAEGILLLGQGFCALIVERRW
jgi:hypothetical protein